MGQIFRDEADVSAVHVVAPPIPEDSFKPKGPCQNCGAREATTWWVGDGGTLAFVHGFGRPWCEPCCFAKQLEHAEEQARSIPEIRLRIERSRLLEVLGRRAKKVRESA